MPLLVFFLSWFAGGNPESRNVVAHEKNVVEAHVGEVVARDWGKPFFILYWTTICVCIYTCLYSTDVLPQHEKNEPPAARGERHCEVEASVRRGHQASQAASWPSLGRSRLVENVDVGCHRLRKSRGTTPVVFCNFLCVLFLKYGGGECLRKCVLTLVHCAYVSSRDRSRHVPPPTRLNTPWYQTVAFEGSARTCR